jgi:hypothetical protein
MKDGVGFQANIVACLGQTAASLKAQFGQRVLWDVNHADGEAFRDEMKACGMRATTIHKRLGHARQCSKTLCD